MEPNVQINLFVASVVTGLLNGIGAGLKATPRLPNHWIPVLLAVVGGPLYCIFEGWTRSNASIGVFLGLTAVGLHQAYSMTKDIVRPKPDSHENIP